MDAKKRYIVDTAIELQKEEKVMSVPKLAENLNANGFLTNYGEEYQGGRGTYALLKKVYHYLMNEGLANEAAAVALSFVKPDGSYAYD